MGRAYPHASWSRPWLGGGSARLATGMPGARRLRRSQTAPRIGPSQMRVAMTGLAKPSMGVAMHLQISDGLWLDTPEIVRTTAGCDRPTRGKRPLRSKPNGHEACTSRRWSSAQLLHRVLKKRLYPFS